MDNPFCYGEAVSGRFFTNRENEIRTLENTLRSGQNVIITSPRRYGKTSLIKRVLSDLKRERLLTVYVDLYPATSKERFVHIYAKAIAENFTSKFKKSLSAIRELLPRLIPRLTVKTDGSTEFEFSFDFRNKSQTPILKDLYEAVHRIALQKRKRGVVVFDEFQEILNFEDDEIERSMRSHFQFHRNIAYAFLGSKTHLMYKIFGDSNRPFYKSGMFFPLRKMSPEVLSKWVKKRFVESKIRLEKGAQDKIIYITANHPYFVQMLCHSIWNLHRNKELITERDVEDSLEEVLTSQSENYLNICDNLTAKQRQFITALAREPEANIFSKDFLISHGLGTPSGMQRIVKSLIEKSIIEKENGQHIFYDVFFPLWLNKQSAII